MEFHLLRHGQIKEPAAHIEHRMDELLGNAMVLHVHEASVRQSPTYLLGHCLLVAAIEKGRDIDHRNLVKAFALRTQLVVQSGNEIYGH